MAIVIHSPADLNAMRRSGHVAAQTLATVVGRIRAGISTAEIDHWVREDTSARGARPSQLGYKGFPAAVCTSRNHVVCHGIPSPTERLAEGDIINVDVTSEFEGFHGDTSVTVCIGTPPPRAQRVVDVCRAALEIGIAAVRPGARLGDVGAAIEAFAREHGCTVVREFGGHGIGRHMHMPPHVSHHGPAGRGPRLRPGMTFTIEPMITIGDPAIELLDDGWTVITADRSPTAQFEHTVAVTPDGCEVLTLPSADPDSSRPRDQHESPGTAPSGESRSRAR